LNGKRILPYWFVLLILPGVLAREAPAKERFDVIPTFGWQTQCRRGQWTPVEIFISSRADEPFIGDVELSFNQDNQHRMVVHHPVVIPAAQNLNVPLVLPLSTDTNALRVRLVDQSGNVQYSQSYDLYDFSNGQVGVKMVDPNNILVAVTGKTGLRVSWTLEDKDKEDDKSGAAESTASPGGFGPGGMGMPGMKPPFPHPLVSCITSIESLPGAWTGYSGLDLLVLNDPDWARINPAQDQALAAWVSNGGKVMVICGTNPIPANSRFARLIPFKLAPPVQTVIPAAMLSSWDMASDKPPAAPVWKFPEADRLPAGWRLVYKGGDGKGLCAGGPVGFGQIYLFGFDLKSLPMNTEVQKKKFWTDQLGVLFDLEKLKAKPADPNRGYYMPGNWSPQDAGTDNVLTYLLSISELEPISIWWVLGILGLMAVLIGPVDYLVLKRLNRLPWTYLTFASILTVFTVGAYYGVQYLRAGKNQVRRITVLDKIAGTPHIWQTGYTGIFASRSDDYGLTGVAGHQWWSGITPSQTYGYGSRSNLVRSTIECFQQEGNVPVSLPVNIWTMRTLADESSVDRFPLRAAVSTDGKQIKAEIENTGRCRVTNGSIRLKDRWLDFGTIAPGQTLRLDELPSMTAEAHPVWCRINENDENYNYFPGMGSSSLQPWLVFRARGVAARTAGIDRYIRDGSAVIYAQIEESTDCPMTLKGKDAEALHTCYLRLVVPGKVQVRK